MIIINKKFATTTWDIEDIICLDPDLTEEEAHKIMSKIETKLLDITTEAGNEFLNNYINGGE